MASLLVIIFVVEVAVVVVNSIGAATINDLLWKLYISTPMSTSKQIREQRELQASYLKVRRDLNATSSQDEFAKWAKLRRQHDKMLEQLEKMKSGIESSRGSFDKTISSARWLGTSGMRWFLPFWYSREPMFWLPHGWFPYYAEWLISFPRAPLGSVSVASWQLACRGVIALVADTIGAILKLVADARQKAQAKQQQQQQQQQEKEKEKMEEPLKASAALDTEIAQQSGDGEESKKES